MHRLASLLAATLVLPGIVAGESIAPPSTRAEWRFSVTIDDKPLGTHRFVLEGREGDATRTLTSDARFDVELLGLSVYRYRHSARERWKGDCVADLTARTEDGGTTTEVTARATGGALAVEIADDKGRMTRATGRGCLMTFAYWNPALGNQRELLDPGTGRIESVEIKALSPSRLDVRGRSVVARGWRIVGLARPIDVWYDGEQWVGLDTAVAGDRRLAYRLR
jgi:hypothetical protein